MTETNSANYYANPENRRITGPARRRGVQPQLSNHLPIRFSPATMAGIRALAARDGVTMSSLVRGLVEREVDRRLPVPRTAGGYELHKSLQDAASTQETTANQAGPRVEESLELLAS